MSMRGYFKIVVKITPAAKKSATQSLSYKSPYTNELKCMRTMTALRRSSIRKHLSSAHPCLKGTKFAHRSTKRDKISFLRSVCVTQILWTAIFLPQNNFWTSSRSKPVACRPLNLKQVAAKLVCKRSILLIWPPLLRALISGQTSRRTVRGYYLQWTLQNR